ncbi:hypothetical protein [Streptomyces bugieae]|uniref:Uncharacterized protein n=1 Tax=Streptomyces bugieae TaxID=3098223 RepID=A0ABU7NKY7_9ACTN|nr:hypothetical protein [Streptomyces sp. DSM 41528]
MDINLTGKTWVNKKAAEMTLEELGDAADTYRKAGGDLNRNWAGVYEREWERRHGLRNANDYS